MTYLVSFCRIDLASVNDRLQHVPLEPHGLQHCSTMSAAPGMQARAPMSRSTRGNHGSRHTIYGRADERV